MDPKTCVTAMMCVSSLLAVGLCKGLLGVIAIPISTIVISILRTAKGRRYLSQSFWPWKESSQLHHLNDVEKTHWTRRGSEVLSQARQNYTTRP
uniref:ABC transmembrane type-1 domain-containing protein n=1 Tax=Steinernema glaseri TaxID=37863 RepID=A0A1I8ATA1_9BILA